MGIFRIKKGPEGNTVAVGRNVLAKGNLLLVRPLVAQVAGKEIEKDANERLKSGSRKERADAAVELMKKAKELGGRGAQLLKEALFRENDAEIATVLLKAYEYSFITGPRADSEELYSTASSLLEKLEEHSKKFRQKGAGDDAVYAFENALFGAVANSFYPKTNVRPEGLEELGTFAMDKANERQLYSCIKIIGTVELPPENSKEGISVELVYRETILGLIETKTTSEKARDKARTHLDNLKNLLPLDGKLVPALHEGDRHLRLLKQAAKLAAEIS